MPRNRFFELRLNLKLLLAYGFIRPVVKIVTGVEVFVGSLGGLMYLTVSPRLSASLWFRDVGLFMLSLLVFPALLILFGWLDLKHRERFEAEQLIYEAQAEFAEIFDDNHEPFDDQDTADWVNYRSAKVTFGLLVVAFITVTILVGR